MTIKRDHDTQLQRLCRFLDIVEAEQRDVHGVDDWAKYDRYVINRDWWETPVEIEVTSRSGRNVSLSVSPQGASSLNPVEAPLSSWTITQTTDDGNLVTSLTVTKSAISAGVSVYGPAVSRTSSNPIELIDADEEKYLL